MFYIIIAEIVLILVLGLALAVQNFCRAAEDDINNLSKNWSRK